jgi:N-acyl-D-aspartate/D-glutamate deacylase
MGDDATRRAATSEELGAMVDLVGASLAAGALGFSSSLGEGHVDGDGRPVPSRAAAFEEFVTLAAALRSHPGTTLEFIPTVGPISDERMDLMADMSLAADRPLNWNLLGSLASEEIYEQQLRASDVAASRGAHVIALTLPDLMRMRSSNLLATLPGWRSVLMLDENGRREAANDPQSRADLRAGAQKVAQKALGVLSDFRLMEVADVGSPWAGRSLDEIARSRGTDVFDVLIDVVLVENLTLFVVLPSLAPSLGRSDEGWRVRASVWKDPRVMLGGSDAGAHVDLMCHANYPTVVLGEGWLADLVVFDPTRVASQPTTIERDLPGGGERLHAGSLGVDHVFVGGDEVVTAGVVTDERPGRVLRSGRDTDTVSLADVRR